MFKVLIADDEPDVCRLIGHLIEWDLNGLVSAGTAENGSVCLKRIREERPDIVITDIRMPGMDGLELIRQVKEEGFTCRFVIISGYQQFEYARRALRYDVEDYLLKPVGKRELNDCLKRIVERLGAEDAETEAAARERGGWKEGAEAPGHAVGEPGRESRPVRLAKQYIGRHYMEQIRLSEISEMVYMNPSYFSTVFKKEIGISFSDYVIEQRIEAAKRLLRESGCSVREIAERVGYTETAYFSRLFKKQVGIKPSQYRKLHS